MFLTTTGATTPSFFETYGTIIFLVLMLGVMYLTVVIPQRKEEKARNELRNSLEVGDGVVTIGGIIGVSAILIRKELLLPILCGIFVAESGTVLIQRLYFKCTKKKYGQGRRIWSSSPLHHHFQKKKEPDGLVIFHTPVPPHHEAKIVARFWIIGIILVVSTLALLKLR